MRDVNYGWLLRYLHANGASMFFLAVYIHIFRGLYYGSYKEPREVLWILGVIIFLLMMATAFMGYVLPWGQMSFWAATVITNLFSAIPLVGERDHDLAVGRLRGRRSDAEPLLLAALSAAVHDRRRRRAACLGAACRRARTIRSASTSSRSRTPCPSRRMRRSRTCSASVCFLILLAWLVFFLPNYLGHPDNYIPADPLKTPAHIVPEWYFLPFYAILRAIPNKLLGVIALFGSIAVLVFMPWLDTSRVRSAVFRPIYRQFFWIFVLVCIGLGYLGSQPPEGGYVIVGAHSDRLLLHPFPDHPAGHRHDRATEADAGEYHRGGARQVEERRRPKRRKGRPAVQNDAGSAMKKPAVSSAHRSRARRACARSASRSRDGKPGARSGGEGVPVHYPLKKPPQLILELSPASSATTTPRSCSAAFRSTAKSARPAIRSNLVAFRNLADPGGPRFHRGGGARRWPPNTRSPTGRTTTATCSSARASPRTISRPVPERRRPPPPPMAAPRRRICR